MLAIITGPALAIAYPKTLKTVGVIDRASLNTDWFNNEELNMIIDNNWVTQLGSMQTLRFPVYEKTHRSMTLLPTHCSRLNNTMLFYMRPLQKGWSISICMISIM